MRLADVLDATNTASDVWADTAYRSAKNETMLKARGLISRIHRRKPKGKPMPERTRRANAAKSKVRAAVEHVFAHEKGPMALVVCTIGLARAKGIGLANLAYTMRRSVWLRARATAGCDRQGRTEPPHGALGLRMTVPAQQNCPHPRRRRQSRAPLLPKM